jgi:hypothetical protein
VSRAPIIIGDFKNIRLIRFNTLQYVSLYRLRPFLHPCREAHNRRSSTREVKNPERAYRVALHHSSFRKNTRTHLIYRYIQHTSLLIVGYLSKEQATVLRSSLLIR